MSLTRKSRSDLSVIGKDPPSFAPGLKGLSLDSMFSAHSLTLGALWLQLVPAYESSRGRYLLIDRVRWENRYADDIQDISEKRATNRIKNYLDQKEIERVHSLVVKGKESSVRFGVAKEGHGYGKERGDFCLTSGVIDGRDLFLHYRSLELIGGFAYDLCLVRELGMRLGIQWRTLSLFAVNAFVFALKGNSNERLYPKLRAIFEDRPQ